MNDKTFLREKIEKDVGCAQVRLAAFKAQLQSDSSGVHATNAARRDVLQQRIEEAKNRLLNLNYPHESIPEEVVTGVEKSWGALQDSLQDAISTFEGQH